MVRKLGIIIAVLCMIATFAVKAGAEQAAPSTGNAQVQGQAQADQIRQEMESLRQQAEQIRSQIEQIRAQVKPLREQLHSIREKIKDDKGKLRRLKVGNREEHREHHQQALQQHQAPATPQQQ